MRIVITGATGNVGTALLRELAADRDGAQRGHELVGVSRHQPPDTPPYDQLHWVAADLSEPAGGERLAEACRGADAVVHLAWLIQPSYDRELLRRTNQGGTARVIEAVTRAGVPHLVHFSSIGVYSPAVDARPVGEDYPHEGVPTSPYSVDKAAAEAMLDRFEAEHPETVVSRLRPGLILQPAAASEISRYFLPRPVPTALLRQQLLRLAPFPSGVNLQFVHAEDVARAVALVLEHQAGGAFNVATDPPLDRASWRELFGGALPPVPVPVLRALAHASWAAHLQPVDPGWLDLAANLPVMNTNRIRDLGWTPSITSDQLLRQFVEALRHGDGLDGPALWPRRRLSRMLGVPKLGLDKLGRFSSGGRG